MTKARLLDAIAKANGRMSKKQVNAVVDAVFMTIAGAIQKDGEFSYPGFGSFKVRKQKSRSSRTIGFKPAKAFKSGL